MVWSIYYLLLLLPPAVTAYAGWLCGRFGMGRVASLAILIPVTACPIGHLFILRAYRDIFMNLTPKSEIVALFIASDIMRVAVPFALIAAFVGWRAGRTARTRTAG